MYPDLQKELATFERRTPKSAEAHKKNLKRIPLGVASNYRAYDPRPIFVKEASRSRALKEFRGCTGRSQRTPVTRYHYCCLRHCCLRQRTIPETA